MVISEPTTLATDYALGTLSEVLGIVLLRRHMTLRETCILLWGIALMAAAMSSYLGGTYHGFQHALGPHVSSVLWTFTTISMGVASFLLLASAFTATFSGGVRSFLIAVAAIKLAFYGVWMAGHDDFRFVIYDYGSTLLILLFLVSAGWTNGLTGHRAFVAAGILVSIGAAAVQQSGFQLYPHFNHNDLMHVVQMIGVWLLFKGGGEAYE